MNSESKTVASILEQLMDSSFSVDVIDSEETIYAVLSKSMHVIELDRYVIEALHKSPVKGAVTKLLMNELSKIDLSDKEKEVNRIVTDKMKKSCLLEMVTLELVSHKEPVKVSHNKEGDFAIMVGAKMMYLDSAEVDEAVGSDTRGSVTEMLDKVLGDNLSWYDSRLSKPQLNIRRSATFTDTVDR